MTNLKNVCVCLSLIALLSCEPQPQRDEKVVKELFIKETLDSTVISKLHLYDSLRTFLFANVDTIMKFRNISDFDPFGSDIQQSFNSRHLKDELPLHIYPKADSLCTEIGKDIILHFTLGLYDNEPDYFSAKIKFDYIKSQCTKNFHDLTYSPPCENSDFFGDFESTNYRLDYSKDTCLTNNWSYVIRFENDCGW